MKLRCAFCDRKGEEYRNFLVDCFTALPNRYSVCKNHKKLYLKYDDVFSIENDEILINPIYKDMIMDQLPDFDENVWG